jgi:hypothetical protein
MDHESEMTTTKTGTANEGKIKPAIGIEQQRHSLTRGLKANNLVRQINL